MVGPGRETRIGGNGEAFGGAPTDTETEKLDALDHGGVRCFGRGFEHRSDQTADAGEIALPDRVSGIARQRRAHDRVDFGLELEPLGDLERGGAMMGEARMERAKRSEEHTSELQSLMRISYDVFCLTNKRNTIETHNKR